MPRYNATIRLHNQTICATHQQRMSCQIDMTRCKHSVHQKSNSGSVPWFSTLRSNLLEAPLFVKQSASIEVPFTCITFWIELFSKHCFIWAIMAYLSIKTGPKLDIFHTFFGQDVQNPGLPLWKLAEGLGGEFLGEIFLHPTSWCSP